MIDEDLVCDGNHDCPINDFMGISTDEATYECAADGEYYVRNSVHYRGLLVTNLH